MELILASQSPRRSELLSQLGLKHIIDPSSYAEEMHLKLSPDQLVKHLSLQKAQNVAPRHPHDIIIGADTIVVIDGKILGKAHTENDAREMLQLLSGKKHSVVTGLALLFPDPITPREYNTAVSSDVYFKSLTQQDIDWYISTKEPLEKAGAYAIQGFGAVFVEKISGSYSTIVGLPLEVLYAQLLNNYLW